MLLRTVLLAPATGLAFDAHGSPVAPSAKKREVPRSHVLHERHLPHWSQRWTKRDKVDGSAMLPMRIGLKQSNLEAGHDRLMDM